MDEGLDDFSWLEKSYDEEFEDDVKKRQKLTGCKFEEDIVGSFFDFSKSEK